MKSFCLCIWILISCQKSALGQKQQSPINLVGEGQNCGLKRSLKPLTMFKYTSASKLKATLTNTGNTAEVDIEAPANDQPGISGGPLREPYTLSQYHFHWGKKDKGSEHTVNKHRFAMEIHLVHYKTQYGSFTEATKYKDGLVVLAFFVDVGETLKYHYLETFTQHLIDIGETNSTTEVEPKAFYKFRDTKVKTGYFNYNGSLTTPPYSENVQWIVFVDPIHGNYKEIARFRKLKNGTAPILQNWRPIQPTNNRPVCYF